ncbi:MAG: hypothetical protein ACI4EV_01440, partial [Lachnospiraceae bacterium]
SVEPAASEYGTTTRLDQSVLQPENTTEAGENQVKPKVQQQVISASSTFGNNPRPEAFAGEQGNVVKKKKKWPKVLAIVAVIAVVLGAATYFAWPMIEGFISPKSKAVHALKNVSGNAKEAIDDAFTNGIKLEIDNTKTTSDIKLEKAVFDGVDYTNAIKSKNFFSVNEVSVDDGEMAGTVGIGTSSNPVLSLEYYISGTRAYFKIPQLTSQSFYVNVDSNMDLSGLSNLGSMGSIDTSAMQAYSKYVTAASNDIFDALDDFWEDLSYEYVGKDTYNSINGDIKVGVYNVTITEKAIKSFVKNMLNNLFDDKELSSLTSLISLTGYTKDSIISMIDQQAVFPSDFDGIKFQMYVSDKGDITKLILDSADYGSDQQAKIGIAFVGKDNPTDMIEFEVISDVATCKAYFGIENGNLTAKMDMVPDQSKNPDEFLSFEINGKANGNSFDLTKLSIKGRFNDQEMDVEASASVSTSSFVYLSHDASDFRNATNVENMSLAKQESLKEEILENLDVLEKILSPSLINDIIGDYNQ